MQCPKCECIVSIITETGSKKCLRCYFEWWSSNENKRV